jgi:hypothetical protein
LSAFGEQQRKLGSQTPNETKETDPPERNGCRGPDAVAPSVKAQQITGTPGSPSATTTIDGKQLPPQVFHQWQIGPQMLTDETRI